LPKIWQKNGEKRQKRLEERRQKQQGARLRKTKKGGNSGERRKKRKKREKARNAVVNARNVARVTSTLAQSYSQKLDKDDATGTLGKKRGRPKGSRNKSKDGPETENSASKPGGTLHDSADISDEKEKKNENPAIRKFSMDFQMAIVRHQNDTKRLLKESAAKGLPTVPTEMMNPARLKHMNEMKAANEALRREGGDYFDNSVLTQKLSHAEAVAVRLYVEEAKQEARKSAKQDNKSESNSNESKHAEASKPKKTRKSKGTGTKKGSRKQDKKKAPSEAQKFAEAETSLRKHEAPTERAHDKTDHCADTATQDSKFDSGRFADSSETAMEEDVNQTEASPWMTQQMVDEQEDGMGSAGPVPIGENIHQQRDSPPDYGNETPAGLPYSMQQYGINDTSLQRQQLNQGALLRSSALAGLATGADGSLMGSSNMSQQQLFSGAHDAQLSQIEQNLRLPMQQPFGNNLYSDHARQQNLPLGQYTSAIQDLISGAGQGQLHQLLPQGGGIQGDPMSEILNRNPGIDFDPRMLQMNGDPNAIDPTTGAPIKQQQGYDPQGQMGYQMSNPSSRHTQQLQSQLSDQYAAFESSFMGQRAGAASYLQDRAMEQNFGAQSVLQDLEPRPIGNVDNGRAYNPEQSLLSQGTNPNSYGNASLYFPPYHNN